MLRKEEEMNIGFTKKGKYVVALIKAVRTVTTIALGGRY